MANSPSFLIDSALVPFRSKYLFPTRQYFLSRVEGGIHMLLNFQSLNIVESERNSKLILSCRLDGSNAGYSQPNVTDRLTHPLRAFY